MKDDNMIEKTSDIEAAFLPRTLTLADPVILLGLFPRLLFLGLALPLSSFISWIAASMSEVFSIILSSFISLIAASISTGSKVSPSFLSSLAIWRRFFKGLEASLFLKFLFGMAEFLPEVDPEVCPFLRMPNLLLPAGFLRGFFVVVFSVCEIR